MIMAQGKTVLSKLIMQYQTGGLRVAPSPVAAKVIPFSKFDFGRDPGRQKNDSLNGSALGNKSDAGSPVIPAQTMESILDLRTVGYLLKLLLGAPTTTGTTLKSHTFPIDIASRPYAMFERQHSDISKFFRWYGVHCNKLSWDIKNADQNISAELFAAQEIDPIPTSAFDAAPTAVAAFRANSGSGVISNGVDTALGTIIGGNIEISSNINPEVAADGNAGYSIFTPMELTFKGKIKCVFDGTAAYDLARTGTSTRLKILSAATIGANTFDLTVDMPYVELIEKAVPVSGKSGMVVDMDWIAHTGATLPTVVLRNDVTAY
jgi:hypothetical protein